MDNYPPLFLCSAADRQLLVSVDLAAALCDPNVLLL